jgi:AmiR/NasT family two-component response regulator
MQDKGFSELEAYNHLQQRAQKERRTLLEVAQELIRDSQEHLE